MESFVFEHQLLFRVVIRSVTLELRGHSLPQGGTCGQTLVLFEYSKSIFLSIGDDLKQIATTGV